MPNKALQPTGQPLRGCPSAEFWRYAQLGRSLVRRIFGIAALALSACTTQYGYMNESGQDPNTGRWTETHYSPYYEFEQRSDDRAVLSRMVITLGGERVPEGHKFTGPFSEDLKTAHRDGIVEWVWEVYLINTSKVPITVTPKTVMGSPSTGQPLEIPPGQWKITPPLVGLHSNYGVESPVSFEYEYAGKTYKVEGTAKRLTVEQVKQKYGGH
jgi:hypothetical protein